MRGNSCLCGQSIGPNSEAAGDTPENVNLPTKETFAETNGLNFGNLKGKNSVLVVQDNDEMAPGALAWTDADMQLNTHGAVRVLVLDGIDPSDKAGIYKAIKDQNLGGIVFPTIVLNCHSSPAGPGDRMAGFYSVGSPLIGALSQHLGSGGSVWWGGCFGEQYFDSHSSYVSGLKSDFNGAELHAGPGYGGTFSFGLASQQVINGQIGNRFYDFKAY